MSIFIYFPISLFVCFSVSSFSMFPAVFIHPCHLADSLLGARSAIYFLSEAEESRFNSHEIITDSRSSSSKFHVTSHQFMNHSLYFKEREKMEVDTGLLLEKLFLKSSNFQLTWNKGLLKTFYYHRISSLDCIE